MKKFSFVFYFAIVILLAGFLRLYGLGTNPPSPYWEEVALGYDAYSISQTGKDFHGNPYPILAFPSYGDFKPSGYFYALVPFVKVFGLSAWTVRLPSALAGIVSVIFLFLIGKELFDRKVGLVASLLFAISPWAIQFSRGGWEVNLAMMLTLMGAYSLLLARSKRWVFPLSVVFFGLSMYTYHAARLFSPVVGGLGGLSLIIFWWNQTGKNKVKSMVWPVVAATIVGLIFVVPFVVNLNNQVVSSRFSQTTVLSDLEPVLKSNAQISRYGGGLIARLAFHRYWFYGREIFQGWIKHFSPEFLFLKGDGNLRHWNGRYGMLYPLDFVFILVSVAVLLLAHKQKELRVKRVALLIIVIWILLAALPPSLVKPTPHALRFLFAAPAFSLMSAFGICVLLESLRRREAQVLSMAIIFAYSYLFGSYFYWYMNIYPSRAASDWQYGYKQVFESLAAKQKQGERVYMTREQGRPSMYYLFFNKYDPAKIQVAGSSLPKDQQELLQVDNYYFVDSLGGDAGLYATSMDKVDPKAKVLDTIRQPDGRIVWVIWRR